MTIFYSVLFKALVSSLKTFCFFMHYQIFYSPFSWGRRARFSAKPLFSKFKTTLIAAWQNWKFPLRQTPKTRNWQINKRARVLSTGSAPPADLFNIPRWFILKCLILTVQFRRRASDGGANKARRRPRRSIPEVELCAAVWALYSCTTESRAFCWAFWARESSNTQGGYFITHALITRSRYSFSYKMYYPTRYQHCEKTATCHEGLFQEKRKDNE